MAPWHGARRAQSAPATRNRIRDDLMAAILYSQMLYQLSYSQRCPLLKQSRLEKILGSSPFANYGWLLGGRTTWDPREYHEHSFE